MKKNIFRRWLKLWTAVVLVLAGCTGAKEETPVPEASQTSTETTKDTESIVILHTNDVHCAVNSNIGYDGLYLYLEEMRQNYENVLLVDAGDAIQGGVYGALSKGYVIVDIMNDVGYDIAIPGNHEFDYGFEVLDDLSEKLECGYICANFCTADGEPVFEPYRIIEAGKKKIAFIGIDTPTTFSKSTIHTLVDDTGLPMYDFLADETGDRLVECVQKNVDEVRAKGADIVVLLCHLGIGEDSDGQYRSDEVVKRTSGIDFVIDGHSHDRVEEVIVNKDGKEVPVAQTGTKFAAIGKAVISSDNTIATELVEEVPEPEGIKALKVTRGKQERWVDADMKQWIEELISGYDVLLQEKIGEIAYDLPVRSDEEGDFSRRQENGMCNLFTDAMRELAETDIALTVSAGVRLGLSKGDILLSDAIASLPYSNDIVVISIKGKDLLDALEFGARKLPKENNGFLQVSGMEYTVDLSIPSSIQEDVNGMFVKVNGPYRVTSVTVNGQPLDPEKEYTAAVTEYLAGGGDGMAMMANTELIWYTMMADNDMLAEYIKTNLNGVVPERYQTAEGRIKILE